MEGPTESRMQTRTRPSSGSGTRKRIEPEVSHRPADVGGIVLCASALILLLGLALHNCGALGNGLAKLLSSLFGKGAWVVPPVMALIGGALLAGRARVSITRVTWGLLLIFCAVVGLLARQYQGDYFDPEVVSAGGGYLGAVLGWAFGAMLGVAKGVGLVAMLLVGVVLCANAPLRDLTRNATQRIRRNPAPKPVEAEDDEPRKTRAAAAVRMLNESATEQPKPEKLTRPAPIIRDTQSPDTVTLDTGTAKEGYNLPPLSLLAEPQKAPKRSPQEMQQNIETLETTLEQFGIEANVVEVATGPTITRYEIQLGPGIRVGRISALADNIAMNMKAGHVRVEAPIPGKAAIGVEVPNRIRSMVTLRELCESLEFHDNKSRLMVALGKDVSGVNKYTDLTRMPHLLIGGATNSGKSISLTTIIMSLILRNTPKDVRLVMIDPKRVELTFFDGLPHMMCPVVKDVKEAPGVLRAVWREMDRRYDKFSEAGVRNIDGWNEKASFQDKLPYIVVVIDELADLMMQAAAEVETAICRLAQLARATGIHLVIATQRPSVDVITGTIKANIASRIAFAVTSHIDSRTILDQSGADKLVGRGDMLFLPIDATKPVRIQGCYVSEKEIEDVCDFWRQQEKPQYVLNPVQIAIEEREAEMKEEQEADPLWEDAVRWVVDRGQASTSMLQRRFSIGFQRASRMLDMMEERGIVGPRDGPRPREVLLDPMEAERMFGRIPYDPPVDGSSHYIGDDE